MALFYKSLVLVLAVSALSIEGAVISKRQIGFTGLAGGFSPASVDDVDVKEMAAFATSAVSASSNSGPASLVQIVKAETQVVAGTNYKLSLLLNIGPKSAPEPCEVVIFNQPWTNTLKMIKSSCSPTTATSIKRITRQSPVKDTPLVKTENIPIAGGFSQASVDDTDVKDIAAFATTAIAASSNSGPLSLIEIVKAETQVVAGTNYRLSLLLKTGANSAPMSCEVIIFDQPWTKTRSLTDAKCTL